jgi:hypothetical protein
VIVRIGVVNEFDFLDDMFVVEGALSTTQSATLAPSET